MATQTTSNGGKKLKFKPIENFDVDKLPPDLPAGKWGFLIDRVDVRAISQDKGGWPMLSFKLKVQSADDETNESYIGKSVDEVIVIYGDDSAKGAKMGKIKLRQLCELLDLVASIPRSITEETLEEFAEELRGKEFEAWTTVRTLDSGEERTNMQYVEPGGGMKLAPSEEEEEETPKKGKTSASKGKGARR